MPTLIFIGGLLHFAILIASVLVPRTLDWKVQLAKLPRLLRDLIWVHGVFIVLVIIGFGTLSVTHASLLAGSCPLARSICAFIAIFWFCRLIVQAFIFDAERYLTTPLLAAGYHGLSGVFIYLTLTYAAAALV